MIGLRDSDRVGVARWRHQIVGQLAAYQEHEHRQQDPRLLRLEPAAEPRAELRADHAAGDQQQRQQDVDAVVGVGVQEPVTAATKQIWNREVPTTTAVGMPIR